MGHPCRPALALRGRRAHPGPDSGGGDDPPAGGPRHHGAGRGRPGRRAHPRRRAGLGAPRRRNGRVPAGSFVALRTGWSRRLPDPVAMANRDEAGISRTPGWSPDVLRYLFEDADVTAIGHEQTDTDPGLPGSTGDYSRELYALQRDRWQIELLANLDRVPEAGALIVATWPKPYGGSGFPARVFALHPAPGTRHPAP
ncbi:cyclase family protein [Streptomyces sp. NPDC051963]|uniref:cyclase family protein n=1 Tax=Streptomyces sp. NPDC051963 TaxID=3365678 RepID=UPI0037D7941C